MTTVAAPSIVSSISPNKEGLLKAMELKKPARENAARLYGIPLQKVDCSFDLVTEIPGYIYLQDVVKRNAKQNRADVTIMYAIRQPSCPSCREHGLQLKDFAAKDHKLALIGAVKEAGTADVELLTFYQRFFRNPIYKDEKWNVFKALGGRKMSIMEAVIGFMRSKKRFQRKGIPLVTKHRAGDSFMQGGVMIFDKNGELRFTYNTEFQEYDMDLVSAAVKEARSP